jgi:uncharacterized protein
MEKFIVSKNTNGEFEYDFLNTNGESIFSKSGYRNKGLCLNAIESIRKNTQDDSKFFRKRTPEDKCYFKLKSSNGQILGTSKVFEDKNSREESILLLKIASTNAIVEDYTKKRLVQY